MSPRRRAMLALPLAGAAWAWQRVAHAQQLPAAQSLAQELQRALSAGKPLVVMASVAGCPFCRIVREHHLAPLQREGLPVVQMELNGRETVRDFNGASRTHGELLRAWGVAVAPTVLFFGRGGREAAPRLAGASIPDFYGAYLDERLLTAARQLG